MSNIVYFTELSEDVHEKWETFVSGTLAEVNKQNTVELVSTVVICFFK